MQIRYFLSKFLLLLLIVRWEKVSNDSRKLSWENHYETLFFCKEPVAMKIHDHWIFNKRTGFVLTSSSKRKRFWLWLKNFKKSKENHKLRDSFTVSIANLIHFERTIDLILHFGSWTFLSCFEKTFHLFWCKMFVNSEFFCFSTTDLV